MSEKEYDYIPGMEAYARSIKKGGVHFVKDIKNSDSINKCYVPFNCGKVYPYRSKKRGAKIVQTEEIFVYNK